MLIKGKITDASGNPLYQIAQISEISTVLPINGVLPVVGVNTWSNPETGYFEFNALQANSIIKVSSYGYKEVTFPVNAVPSVIKLPDGIVLEGKRKKDNTLYWVLSALAVLGLGYAVSKKKKNLATPKKTIKKVTA